jgi:hypothetical protein
MYFPTATRKEKSGTYQSLHLVESYRFEIHEQDRQGKGGREGSTARNRSEESSGAFSPDASADLGRPPVPPS